MYIDFKHGLPEGIVQFDQTIQRDVIDNTCIKFKADKNQNISYQPKLKVSFNPPNNNQGWEFQQIPFQMIGDIYLKEINNQIYFYFKVNRINTIRDRLEIRIMVMNLLVISNILKYDILFLHGGVLSNGIVYFAPCMTGKTTLLKRINIRKEGVRALCSDGIIITFDNQPLIYSFADRWCYFSNSVQESNKVVKFNSIYRLERGQREAIIEDDVDKWKQIILYGNKRILGWDPYCPSRKSQPSYKWIQYIPKVNERFQKRVKQIIDKFVQKFNIKPLKSLVVDNTNLTYDTYVPFNNTNVSHVVYRIGDIQSTIQFDQYFTSHIKLFDNIIKYNGCQVQKSIIKSPTVKVSICPPTGELQEWSRYSYKNQQSFKRNVILYYKEENNKMYFYFHCLHLIMSKIDINKLSIIIFKCLLLNILKQNKNLIYLHAILFDNGSVVCGDPCAGKTTLCQRIVKFSKKIKVVCDDGILVDFKNKLVYPICYLWDEHNGYNFQEIMMQNTMPLNNLYLLIKDRFEEIKWTDRKEWFQGIFNTSTVFYTHPFRYRDIISDNDVMWVQFKEGLKEQLERQFRERLTVSLADFKPLVLSTNTDDINTICEIDSFI